MFKKFWRAWLRCGRWIGDQVARLFLTVFYFTVALPFGLIVRLTQDPLDVRYREGAGWLQRNTPDKTINNARRAF